MRIPLPKRFKRQVSHVPHCASSHDGPVAGCGMFVDVSYCHSHPFSHCTYPIGSMYAIYGNIYHQYTPNVSIYTIHGSYGYMYIHLLSKIYEIGWSWQSSHNSGTWLQYSATFFHLVAMNILWQHIGMGQSWAPNGTLTSVDYMFTRLSSTCFQNYFLQFTAIFTPCRNGSILTTSYATSHDSYCDRRILRLVRSRMPRSWEYMGNDGKKC